jgi:hypothetical protein
MPPRRRLRGAILILASLLLLVAMAALFAAMAGVRTAEKRERITEEALAQAREALIAYASDRPITAGVGPGYLPCPDLDGDGWAEPTCGSLSGDSGQDQRLGRLPWKTLGLPELRDGGGERLWYAVSSKYKGLLNCAASRACLDMTPSVALGTITVRDPSGHVVHDGTLASAERAQEGGALAVVIAPGAALARVGADGSRTQQRRDCAPGDCDPDGRCLTDPPRRAAPCDPANYLDRAQPEDNAAFVDRNDAAGRALNRDGFIQGPVLLPGGGTAVNDRLLAVTYRDVMPAVMRRVAMEALHCLRYYASRPENGGRYPWPARACSAGTAFGSAADTIGIGLGSVPDTPFARSVESSGARMLGRWWRNTSKDPENLAELPTLADACRIAVAPDDAGPVRNAAPGTPAGEAQTAGFAGNAWWTPWQPFVSYALARAFAPDAPGTPDCAAGACIAIDAAGGQPVARDKELAVIVAASCAEAPACDPARGCERVILAPDADGTRHGIALFP